MRRRGRGGRRRRSRSDAQAAARFDLRLDVAAETVVTFEGGEDFELDAVDTGAAVTKLERGVSVTLPTGAYLYTFTETKAGTILLTCHLANEKTQDMCPMKVGPSSDTCRIMKRTDDFRHDAQIPRSAELSDYKGSGWPSFSLKTAVEFHAETRRRREYLGA